MKSMYYEWTNNFRYQVPDEIIVPEEWDAYSLFLGEKIKKKPDRIKLLFQSEKQISDSIPNSELLLFFSKRMIEFMTKNYSNKLFQILPVEIKSKKK